LPSVGIAGLFFDATLPAGCAIEKNSIQPVFKKEVQVLKFRSF
jgi:hypothetical protein